MRGTRHNPLLSGVLLLAAGFALTASPAAAQSMPLSQVGFGVAAHASTLGLGGDLAVSFGDRLGARARLSFQPYSPSATWDNQVDVTVDMESPTFAALVDFFPTGGGLRATGGLVRFNDGFEINAVLSEAVDFNGTTYQPSDIGSLSGFVSGKTTAPYLGIGWGNAALSSPVGITVDLGVAFYGSPQVELDAEGPFANDPTFRSNLEAERSQLEADLEGYKYYPLLSVGVAVAVKR